MEPPNWAAFLFAGAASGEPGRGRYHRNFRYQYDWHGTEMGLTLPSDL